MPIAAVPEYIGKQDLSQASPGMRFSIYLPIWTERADQEKRIRKMASAKSPQGEKLAEILNQHGIEAAIAYAKAERGRFPKLWEKNDHGAKDAWGLVSRLEKADRNCMTALVARQRAMAKAGIQSGELLVIDAKAVAPFTTGLGNEHPLENGFAFLWPYGLPYLPGSGVKGVLRQAARELASGEWGDSRGWSADKDIEVSLEKETLRISMLDALFGPESEDGEKQHLRGALTFWDVVPQIEGKRLMLEVMTPHQGHYYQQKKERKTGDSITPHDSGQPVPIYFLTVPPGSGFTFHVRCELPFLHRIAPDLAEGGRWKSLMQAAFEHAFDWLGFGAKTAVGYGAMTLDEEAASARRKKQAEARAAAEQERQLAEATAGLPRDAAEIERFRHKSEWRDNNTFLNLAERLLESNSLSHEALKRLEEEMEQRWKGILADPDATSGKRNKPKYKARPKELAKQLIAIRNDAGL